MVRQQHFISSPPNYMAQAQAYFTLGNVLMTFVRLHNGYFTTTVVTDYFYGIGGVVVGTQLGRIVYKYISPRLLKLLVYIYIGISGVLILLAR